MNDWGDFTAALIGPSLYIAFCLVMIWRNR